MDEQFVNDIIKGFSDNPKHLSSKYLYDKRGSQLFQKIMNLPEYYLTNCEYEILSEQAGDIYKDMDIDGEFEIIEFGAGDGTKTKLLLREFLKLNNKIVYEPIDISSDALRTLRASFKEEFGDLNIEVQSEEYFTALEKLKAKKTRKLVLFLGSSIGNFNYKESINFLKTLNNKLNKGDLVLIGFDLVKDPRIILNAYDDREGITKKFNLNLLERINRKFDADFNLSNFEFYPTYNPVKGTVKSYLISLKDQKVEIKSIKENFNFEYSEAILTEISQKFNKLQINDLAKKSGFAPVSNYLDSKGYFTDSLWIVS